MHAFSESLLCRQCGHEVARASDLIKIISPLALRHRNDTFLGVQNVYIQQFKNPDNVHFEVVAVAAGAVHRSEEAAVAEHSWFPGFAWRICVCPRCGFHLGWSFEPVASKSKASNHLPTFLGLILENLVHQDIADSIIAQPKAYGT